MGTFGIGSLNTNIIAWKRAGGTMAGSVRFSKRPKAKKKTKRLLYNFKQLSGRILRSKTSGSARMAAAKARETAAQLRKKAQTGEYDDRELEMAIAHADQMVRIAKKKMKHLRAEEMGKYKNRLTPEEQMQEQAENENDRIACETEMAEEMLRKKMEKLMREAMQQLKELERQRETEKFDEMADEMMVASAEELTPEDMDKLKKKHRCDELKDITLADMKYLKAMFDKLEKEKSEGLGGISYEMSGMDVRYTAKLVQSPTEPASEPVAASEPEASSAPVCVEGGNVDVCV